MLRSFRVANHLSIRDEQELLLMPAYDKHRPVVPVAAIFGANASGKSNLLNALGFMQTAVRTSYAAWEPGTGIPRRPFRLDPQMASEQSLYVVELRLDGVRYGYGFSVDDEQVQQEWLYAYPHERRRLIFERQGRAIRLGSTLPDHRSRETTLADLTRENALFLSAAAQANQPEVRPVYDWFRVGMTLFRAVSPFPGEGQDFGTAQEHPYWDRITSRLLEPDSPDRRALVELIRVADLGISDVLARRRVKNIDVNIDVSKLLETMALQPADAVSKYSRFILGYLESPELLFVQGKSKVPLTIGEQSEGTRAWLALLSDALTALDRGAVLIIDEIDTSLHPRLTARLIELFQDGRTNPHAAQLVFATHDASLLGTSFGREILARDQVWFVEKDDEGATKLFPLTDFHPRKEENTERRYLGGSYGAVPSVFSDTLVEAYLATRSERLDDST